MPIINISVKDKIAIANCEEKIVCGNEDYIAKFEFDEEWQSYEYKTARFAFNKSVITVVIKENQCEIPKLPNTFVCGVEIRAGTKYTTTPAWVECLPNLDDEYGEIEPPTPEVYNKIMELLENAIKSNTELPKGGKKGQVLKKASDEDYDTEWGMGIEISQELGFDENKTVSQKVITEKFKLAENIYLKWVEIPDPNKPVYAIKVSGRTVIEYEDWDDNGESYIATYSLEAPDQIIYLITLSELSDLGWYDTAPKSLYINQWGDTVPLDYFNIYPSENIAYLDFYDSSQGIMVSGGHFTPMAWLQ